ncbi:MAG: MTH1187 family thiamine-binding protein [Candidatus Hydrogenedentes bacterium]|nr:MTH1187 family thiamine-binding protein [Candidatus Hydrogenedentota bacterium]
MNVIADISVIPVGTEVSLSEYVAACQKAIQEQGLTPHLHAYGTNVEGEWDAVMAAVKRCHEIVHEMGAPRVSTTLKLGTRTDRQDTLEGRIQSVQSKLKG